MSAAAIWRRRSTTSKRHRMTATEAACGGPVLLHAFETQCAGAHGSATTTSGAGGSRVTALVPPAPGQLGRLRLPHLVDRNECGAHSLVPAPPRRVRLLSQLTIPPRGGRQGKARPACVFGGAAHPHLSSANSDWGSAMQGSTECRTGAVCRTVSSMQMEGAGRRVRLVGKRPGRGSVWRPMPPRPPRHMHPDHSIQTTEACNGLCSVALCRETATTTVRTDSTTKTPPPKPRRLHRGPLLSRPSSCRLCARVKLYARVGVTGSATGHTCIVLGGGGGGASTGGSGRSGGRRG